jgi:hypothetical protein
MTVLQWLREGRPGCIHRRLAKSLSKGCAESLEALYGKGCSGRRGVLGGTIADPATPGQQSLLARQQVGPSIALERWVEVRKALKTLGFFGWHNFC